MARTRRGGEPTDENDTDDGGAVADLIDQFDETELPTESVDEDEDEEEYAEPDLGLIGQVAEPSEALLAAKEQLVQQLLVGPAEQAFAAEAGTDAYGFENIVGCGIAENVVDGHPTGSAAVTVYVVGKVPSDAVAAAAIVPPEVNGVPTDVVAIGELNTLPYRGRYRPAPGGVSVGHYRITAGTIGCLVRRGRNLYILSNNHVLANVNQGRSGDPILQPGPIDGGKVPADVIAKLSQFVPITLGASGACNHVDAAIAQTSPRLVSRLNKHLGQISASPLAARRDLLVDKCGRTTQYTRGRITDVNFTGRVNFGTSGLALFCNQILVVGLTSAPFSAGGDSGSLIVSHSGKRPVGLLFAGSASHTIANPIGEVLAALRVSIVA